VCRPDSQYRAARLHSRPPGEAVELSCEVYVDKILQLRIRHALLLDCGVAVMLEASEVRAVTRVTFTDVPDAAIPRHVP
jgi:hypothetical protein